MKTGRVLSSLLLSVTFALSLFNPSVTALAAPVGCASSSPASGSYTVTVCITTPANNSPLTGNATVTATASVVGTNPGVQRMLFNLGSTYLLTDYTSPYTFTLPTSKWVDGSYVLLVSALMRDGFTTGQTQVTLRFVNGNAIPPVNTGTFTPSTGTTPGSGQPFVVAASGDGASGETASTNVVNLVKSLNPNLFLYLGDVYESGSKAEFYNWYGTGSSNFSALRVITDPTIGNHEYGNGIAGAGYFDYWNNIPNYYSYNAGGWHFISLNSNSSKINVTTSGAEYAWLQQDLAANPQPCTIVYYHHPLFNIGPEGATTALSSIWSLLAQNKVQIVLNGHDHDYQRWVPLDGNGNPNPTGITEFVAGGAGHGLQTITKTDSRVAYSNSSNPAAFGVLLLTLSSSGAAFSYRSTNGSVLDSGSIACAATAPTATSTPLPAPTNTPTPLPAATNTSTPLPPATNTPTPLPPATDTPTPLPAATDTPTPLPVATATPTPLPPPPTPTPTSGAGQSLTFIPVADTYVDASAPTVNNGTKTNLRTDASPIVNSYIKFNVSGITGTVTRVRLLIFANSSLGTGITANAVADTTWGETTLIYNNAPAMGSALVTSAGIATGTWVTLTVTGYITADGTYSFGITDPSATAISLASRESGANAPQLIIDTQ